MIWFIISEIFKSNWPGLNFRLYVYHTQDDSWEPYAVIRIYLTTGL